MIKVGVIGTGGMGRASAGCLKECAASELVGVFDIDRGAAETAASEHGVRAFDSVERMLDDVEAVLIATPTSTHKEYTVTAARAGKHIMCEKPMAGTVPDCQAMMEAASGAGAHLLIGQILRFFPEFVKAKELVDSGAVGTPAVVRTTRAGPCPHGSGGWFADFERSGGVVLDMAVHDFDWLRWTLGEAERVFAKGLAYRGLDHLDYALITIRFACGAIAHVEASWAYHGGFRVLVEVVGDKGMLDFDNRAASPVTYVTKPEPGQAGSVQATRAPAVRSALQLEIDHFVDVIAHGAKARVQPEDGLKAVEIALGALESIRTGRPVAIS